MIDEWISFNVLGFVNKPQQPTAPTLPPPPVSSVLQTTHLIPITFRAVGPAQINGEKLYERQEQAELLAQCLLESSGIRQTPLCDACFGAGKTSFIYKFRSLLDPEKFGPSFPKLRDAVYLHVCFSNPKLTELHMERDSQETYVIRVIYHTLKISAGSSLPLREMNRLEDLTTLLADVAHQQTLLFHFDDVGAFQDLPVEDLPIKMLYVIWNVGEELRKLNHFYVMTGRSPYLHLIGCRKLEVPTYSSPNISVLINLPPLTEDGIVMMIKEFGLQEKVDADLLNWIIQYTAGVPRAVNAILVSIRLIPTPIDCKRLIFAVRNICQNGLSLLTKEDETIFRRIVEFSWCGIALQNSTVIDNEPLTSIMARLGLFRGPAVSIDMFTIVVPHYVLDYYSNYPSINSLMVISTQDNPGSRLECGFRRILRLRFQLSPCANWSDVGLSFLHINNFPFPQAKMERAYAFPKIAKDHSWSFEEVRNFMAGSHTINTNIITKSEFSAKALPRIYDLMQIGQYYQPLPLSKSADALVRCSDKEIIVFQCKNLKKEFKLIHLAEEAEKCIADGWQVYMVVICPTGHDHLNGENVIHIYKGVTVALLSKASVSSFLGTDAVREIESTSLISDVMGRLTISPVKDNTNS